MGYPFSLLNTVRLYDEAFVNIFQEFLVDYGNISGEQKKNHPILVVMAPQERAYAQMSQLLVRKKWIAGLTDQEQQDNANVFKVVPLPFISVQQKDYTIDPSRSKAPFIFEDFERFEDGTVVAHPHPVPYDITYDVTYWCKTRAASVFFQEWINAKVGDRGAMSNEFFINVEMGPFGSQLHAVHVESVFETSNHTNLLYGFRDFTFLASFTIKGWLFKNPYDDGRKDIVLQTINTFEEFKLGTVPPTDIINTMAGTKNLITLLSKSYDYLAMFTKKDADVIFSAETADDRYNAWTEYKSGTEMAYKFSFTATGAYVRTKILPILRVDTTTAYRYAVKRTTGAAYINILDKNEDVIRRIEIIPNTAWQEITELFVKMEKAMYMEFQADSGDMLVDKLGIYIREAHRGTDEYVTDSDMTDVGVGAWTAVGGGVLSKVTYGIYKALKVETLGIGDGVLQNVVVPKIGMYILAVDVLASNIDYRVTFSNGVQSYSYNCKSVDKSICLVLYTSGNLEVKIEQIGTNGYIIINNIQIRSFFTCPLLIK